jgi:hypothetical protein
MSIAHQPRISRIGAKKGQKISEISEIRGRKTHPGGVSPISHELARRKGKKLVKFVQFVAEKPTLGEYRPSVTNWHEERAKN